jgi:membrane-associated phospholipid phosphatase
MLTDRRRSPDPPASLMGPVRSRVILVVIVVAAAALTVLTLLVATHTTQRLDVAARDYFRPHDEWGPLQRRADLVVEGLKPRNIALLLVVAAVATSIWERSWRPVAYAALLGGVTGGLTLIVKFMLQRPDPHYEMTAVGGSFPSGHMVTVLVSLGGAVLLVWQRSRWWHWVVVALVALTMALSMLVQAAHWFTDLVGGVLLATAVLAAASLWPLRRRAP